MVLGNSFVTFTIEIFLYKLFFFTLPNTFDSFLFFNYYCAFYTEPHSSSCDLVRFVTFPLGPRPFSSVLSFLPSGGPYGAVGVDLAFEAMLCQIFGDDFIQSFKAKRPAAWVDLTIAFEARKRTAAPGRANALNISLPFSFIDYYKRHRGHSVEAALRRSK